MKSLHKFVNIRLTEKDAKYLYELARDIYLDDRSAYFRRIRDAVYPVVKDVL
jgi:hypothetical protein